MASDSSFSYQERLLVSPLPPGSKKQFVHARMESAMTLLSDDNDGGGGISIITPFPRQVHDLLQHHNATEILIQVGTSSSHSYGQEPLDTAEPWFSSGRRLDLGPSGVLVRANLNIQDPREAGVHWESLLHELVAQRIVAAPLFSVNIRRLHRHWISFPTTEGDGHNFELILPMEGASLSSEGMNAFATLFSPCHNQSGIFHWNSPKVMSEFFLKRHSAARHSWWIQMQQQPTQRQEEDEEGNKAVTTIITKGMQFQPHMEASSDQKDVSLTDLFPSSTKHRRCPFVQETNLETLVSPGIAAVELKQGQEMDPSDTTYYIDSRELAPKYWKEPWMTILPTGSPTPKHPPQWSIHQTLQRPRGVAYSGRLITQVIVNPSSAATAVSSSLECPISVDIQWFLPPIVQPTWQSFQIIQEDAKEQVERVLDWRNDLHGAINVIDPTTGQSTSNLPFDEGSIYFHIPQWNPPSSHGKLTISLDYRPAFLSFENFPGDANRGVEIPPAQAIFVQHCPADNDDDHATAAAASDGTTKIHLYSNSLLLLPPVPDMSMPFNVLSMTCSLYAFVIGSLLNLLIRKSSERVQRTYDPSKVPPPSKLQLLISKIKQRVLTLKEKLLNKKKKIDDQTSSDELDNEEEADSTTPAQDEATQGKETVEGETTEDKETVEDKESDTAEKDES